MVSIRELNVRTSKNIQAIDVVFSNNHGSTFVIRPNMTIHGLLKEIDDFKERIVKINELSK